MSADEDAEQQVQNNRNIEWNKQADALKQRMDELHQQQQSILPTGYDKNFYGFEYPVYSPAARRKLNAIRSQMREVDSALAAMQIAP